MSQPKLRLFKVECRGAEGVATFFVPAKSPDEAIIQAMTTVSEARGQHADVADPFHDANLEVRVGTIEPRGSQRIIFGDWSRLLN